MATEGPGPDPDVDEEFARIIAGWDEVASTSGSALLPEHEPLAPPADADDDSRSDDPTAALDDPPADAPTGREHPQLPDERLPAASEELAAEPPTEDADAAARPVDPAYQLEHDAWRGYAPDEEVDEHFEPPEPDLPPAHDATYWLAAVGMAAGPLLVLWAVVFSGDPDPGWMVVAGLVLLAFGFGLLVMRGSGERDPDDDGSRL
ncbi:MAG: hypothetical protein ACOYBY_13540 [Dermatophilaceae bacterium]